MKTALTIAGSDPTGGAGLQADLKAFKSLGVHGLSIPSALTAQTTEGVVSILPVGKKFFLEQMDLLLEDIRPDTLKTGMLHSVWVIEAVAGRMQSFALKDLVVDPVTVSSGGKSLVEQGALDAMRRLLFPLSRVITPNIYEATVLTGMHIEDSEDMKEAARRLKDAGPEVVVITGGHLEKLTLDLYYDGSAFHALESPKIPGEYHGTGCVFSAAIAALLAQGITPLESVKKAKAFVTESILRSYRLGKGMALLEI